MKKIYRKCIEEIKDRIIAHYEDKLVSSVIYGSFARGKITPESDIDLLLIAKKLHNSKMKRMEEFIENVEDKITSKMIFYISPIIITPQEALRGKPISLDMIYDSLILYDIDEFFNKIMERLKNRLKELGSKRIFKGNRWYWLLKPDIKPGEIFEI